MHNKQQKLNIEPGGSFLPLEAKENVMVHLPALSGAAPSDGEDSMMQLETLEKLIIALSRADMCKHCFPFFIKASNLVHSLGASEHFQRCSHRKNAKSIPEWCVLAHIS